MILTSFQLQLHAMLQTYHQIGACKYRVGVGGSMQLATSHAVGAMRLATG